MPHTGSIAVAGSACGAVAARRDHAHRQGLLAAAHGDDAGQDRERDLLGGARADVQPGGRLEPCEALLGQALGVELGDHGRAAHAAGHQADVGQARLEPARAARSARRARGRRRPARGRRPPARRRRRPRRPCRGRARRPCAPRALAIGVSPTTSTRGEASIGSRKISSEPPDRHGFCTVTAPSAAGASSSPGRMRSSSASPVSSARSACRRTLCSAHAPPTKPSIVPSPSTRAASPVRTLVGRCARTTVATTNGVRAARSSSARRLRRAAIMCEGYRCAVASEAQ